VEQRLESKMSEEELVHRVTLFFGGEKTGSR
jgi:hypothetical protein